MASESVNTVFMRVKKHSLLKDVYNPTPEQMWVRFHGNRPAHLIVVMDLEERVGGTNKIGQTNHLCSYSGELHSMM